MRKHLKVYYKNISNFGLSGVKKSKVQEAVFNILSMGSGVSLIAIVIGIDVTYLINKATFVQIGRLP